ncbi:hypothetical protein [Fodinicola feengrottensis]|uniref:hypothetical protein n=1 Tax=Fodinicola feengrottensis TaxID=435914 RepID=UPI0013D418FB|nr:hypothetical protein [Fodinicola feengrottensis]
MTASGLSFWLERTSATMPSTMLIGMVTTRMPSRPSTNVTTDSTPERCAVGWIGADPY